jgi:hypothetical protein
MISMHPDVKIDFTTAGTKGSGCLKCVCCRPPPSPPFGEGKGGEKRELGPPTLSRNRDSPMLHPTALVWTTHGPVVRQSGRRDGARARPTVCPNPTQSVVTRC